MDGDGTGEYGSFGEMTGADGVRANPDASRRKEFVKPPILSPALAGVGEDGIVTKSGHCFRVFLPGKGGRAVREGRAGYWTGGRGSHACCDKAASPDAPCESHMGAAFSGPVDSDLAEKRWCAYAWPVAAGNSGQRVFFVDQQGDVWQSANARGAYSGRGGGPAWDAAMPETTPASGWATPQAVAAEYLGRDGNVWRRTN